MFGPMTKLQSAGPVCEEPLRIFRCSGPTGSVRSIVQSDLSRKRSMRMADAWVRDGMGTCGKTGIAGARLGLRGRLIPLRAIVVVRGDAEGSV